MKNTKLLLLAMLLTLFWTEVSAQAKTRAEVRQELIDLESVGYEPEVDDPTFPCQLQAAEKRLSLVKNGGEEGGGHTASTGVTSK